MPGAHAHLSNAPLQLRRGFERVSHWVFDLDNTLYPAECHLFRQIDARMAAFIERRIGLEAGAARLLQKDYYVRYGTTLNGLMREHNVPPAEFLDFVHDIDVSVVAENPDLNAVVRALPGKRYIFTNGTVKHAENVLARLGLADAFDDLIDIEASGFTPKPFRDAYDRFFAKSAATPSKSAMFEDIAHNLAEPHALGMRTVLVASDADWMADEPAEKRPARASGNADDLRADHIHHVTDDLTGFLAEVVAAISGPKT